MVKRFKEFLEKDSLTAKFMAEQCTPCPTCKIPAEKQYGCNYVVCDPKVGCGKAFCFGCGETMVHDKDGEWHGSSKHMNCKKKVTFNESS